MAKYELMLVVDGSLTETQAREQIANLTTLFDTKNTTDFSETLTLNDTLAYAINKKTTAHRFLYKFETHDLNAIKEFSRLVIINKAVLRHLLINLEKDYAYKYLINPQKLKVAQFRQNKFQQYLANKEKAAAALEAAGVLEANVVEAKMRKVRDYQGLDKTQPAAKKPDHHEGE